MMHSRRRWLQLMSGGFFAISMRPVSFASFPSRTALAAFDHLLLGCSDLESGIAWLEQRTGARARFGGTHPGRGTQNALLSLGPRHYLEIIAPDPAQPNAADERGLKQLSTPRLIQWAIHTGNIAAEQARAAAAGIKTVGPLPGSRKRPDGSVLRWQTLSLEYAGPVAPFFIQWESESMHPSTDAPRLGTAVALAFRSPDPPALLRLLHGIGIEAEVQNGNEPRIVATIETQAGKRVEIT